MIYLSAPNRFQLRLGWLVRAAHLLEAGPMSQAALGEALLGEATALINGEQNQLIWMRESGILHSPRGRLRPKAVNVVRMCTAYGIYDPEAQTLTDLGYVLLAADKMAAEPLPFRWRGVKRFIGLRLLLGADGDFTLALLRRWPGEEARALGAAPVITACLEYLAKASDYLEDRQTLLAQSQRGQPRDLVYPRMEPLRELGYFEPGDPSGHYRLTADGQRLRRALQGAADASSLLRSGLPQAFIRAEGLEPTREASSDVLLGTLRELPDGLRGAANEAPLEAVALLAQCRLLMTQPGTWLDLESAERAVTSLSSQLRGRIGIKAGTSTRTQNITWADAQVLTRELQAPGGAKDVRESPALAEPAVPPPERPPDSSGPPSGSPPPPVAAASPPSAPLQLWLTFLARLLDPPSLGGADGLQNGGPWTWCDTLLRSLERPPEVLHSSRKAHDLLAQCSDKDRKWFSKWGRRPLATLPLRKWLSSLEDQLQGQEPIQRAIDLWERPPAPSRSEEQPASAEDLHALRVALRRAREASRQLPRQGEDCIRVFLSTSLPETHPWDQWGAVAEITRALVEDAVARGLGGRRELSERMRALLRESRSDFAQAAEHMLSAIAKVGQRTAFSFTQDIVFPSQLAMVLRRATPDHAPYVRLRDGEEAEEVYFSAPQASQDEQPAESAPVQAFGRVLAQDVVQARHRAAELVRDGLSRVGFELSQLLPPDHGRDHPRAELQELRLFNSAGEDISPPDSSSWGPAWLMTPRELGFAWEPARSSLRKELSSLPTLARLERTGAVDARARLARTVHWLGIADQLDTRPPDRLTRAWIAVEHLVAEGLQLKGPVVIRHLADAAVLEQVVAIAGNTIREALAALHVNACMRPGDPAPIDFLQEALGTTDEAVRYQARPAGLLCRREDLDPPAQAVSISDREALRLLIRWRSRSSGLASTLEPASPYAAWRLHKLYKHLESNQSLGDWILTLRLDAAALLQHVYDLRNQLVHDADPFVFEESHRLQDLYLRFRALIDPLLASLLHRLSAPGEPSPQLAMMWAELQARYAELHHRLESSLARGHAKHPPDLDFLMSCLDPLT